MAVDKKNSRSTIVKYADNRQNKINHARETANRLTDTTNYINGNYSDIDSQTLSDEMNDVDIYRMTLGDNRENAETQRNWEKMMSDTAHQRETRDLLASGLNPILSANNGASTPTGATATEGEMQTALKQQKEQFKQDTKLMQMQLDNAMDIANMQNAMQKYQIDKNYDSTIKGQQLNKWQTQYNASLQKYLAKYNGKLTEKQMKNAIKIATISANASMFGAVTSANALYDTTQMSTEAQKWITEQNNELKKDMVTVKVLGFSYSGYSGGLWNAYEEFKKKNPNSKLTFDEVQKQINKGKGGENSAG